MLGLIAVGKTMTTRTSSLLLAAIALSPFLTNAASHCSCSSYYAKNAQPKWVGIDIVDDEKLASSGSSQCSGLKTIDERRSAKNAREELAKLLSTDISVKEIIKNTSSSTVSHSDYKSVIESQTNQLLKSAKVYDRYVDPINCTVYAAISISKADLEKGQQEKIKQQQAMLGAKNSCLKVTGENSSQLTELLTEQLLQHGYKLTNSACEVTYLVKNSIIKAQSKLVITQLKLQIDTQSKKSIWQQRFEGKGLSYSKRSKTELIHLANQDSTTNLINSIVKLKNTAINSY